MVLQKILDYLRDNIYPELQKKLNASDLLDELHSIAQKLAYTNLGISTTWASSGTALAAGDVHDLVNISGKGGIHYVRTFSEDNQLITIINIDGTYINTNHLDRIIAIYNTYQGTGKFGYVELLTYDSYNNKYVVIHHTNELAGGKFGSSLRVAVRNDQTVDINCSIEAAYYVLSSKEFKAYINRQFDPLKLRQLICNKAKVPLSNISVISYTEWSEEKQKNLQSVSIMEHQKSKQLDETIRKVLMDYFGISNDQIEEVEH